MKIVKPLNNFARGEVLLNESIKRNIEKDLNRAKVESENTINNRNYNFDIKNISDAIEQSMKIVEKISNMNFNQVSSEIKDDENNKTINITNIYINL